MDIIFCRIICLFDHLLAAHCMSASKPKTKTKTDGNLLQEPIKDRMKTQEPLPQLYQHSLAQTMMNRLTSHQDMRI